MKTWKNKKILKAIFLIFTILVLGVFGLNLPTEKGSSADQKNVVAKVGEEKTYLDPMKGPMGAVMINPMKQQLIGVKKYTVQEKKLVKTIRTVGRVEYDERILREVNLKIEGWIERLYANYTGKYVRKGEPLFKLYSPELLNAQEEYLLATSGRTSSSLKSSAKTKLLLWDISESQINQLEKSKKPTTRIDILSPTSGYIISKSIIEGGHVKPGQTLLQIADIKNVWILGDIYEYELPLIKLGQNVTITSQSFPDRYYSGTIAYIYPNLNLQTRSVKIRIELENPEEILKPGMFTNIQIEVDMGIHLAIPESAVLNSGVRKVVFVSKGNGIFIPNEVELGSLVNGYYPVRKGLAKGDVVVRSANFFLDSESQLTATMEGMMGLIGMGDWKMEHSRMGEMDMGGMQGMKMDTRSDSKTDGAMNMQEGDKTKGETE
ncbi:MAG: efflux RND transporter periplasmic adaptor subunit [Nitrospinae bacterium]|nr:efflux RND transporter periplasmic adaptor subunit [Nitrospinota bacterium]